MKMKVEKSFYMLEIKGEKKSITLFNEISEAVKDIASYLKGGTQADQIEFSEIDVTEKELRVSVVPWSTIAEKLVTEIKV